MIKKIIALATLAIVIAISTAMAEEREDSHYTQPPPESSRRLYELYQDIGAEAYYKAMALVREFDRAGEMSVDALMRMARKPNGRNAYMAESGRLLDEHERMDREQNNSN